MFPALFVAIRHGRDKYKTLEYAHRSRASFHLIPSRSGDGDILGELILSETSELAHSFTSTLLFFVSNPSGIR